MNNGHPRDLLAGQVQKETKQGLLVLEQVSKELIRDFFINDASKRYDLDCIHNPIHTHFDCTNYEKLYSLEAISESLLVEIKYFITAMFPKSWMLSHQTYKPRR